MHELASLPNCCNTKGGCAWNTAQLGGTSSCGWKPRRRNLATCEQSSGVRRAAHLRQCHMVRAGGAAQRQLKGLLRSGHQIAQEEIRFSCGARQGLWQWREGSGAPKGLERHAKLCQVGSLAR